jgi:hypothetical protein
MKFPNEVGEILNFGLFDLSGKWVKLDEPTSGLEYNSPPAQNAGWKVCGQKKLYLQGAFSPLEQHHCHLIYKQSSFTMGNNIEHGF